MTHSTQDSNNEKAGGGFLSGLLMGGLVGAALGYLLAPRSGEETMAMLREKGSELKEQVEQSASEVRSRAETMAQDMRVKAETKIDETRAMMDERKGQIERTAEAVGKSAKETWKENQPA